MRLFSGKLLLAFLLSSTPLLSQAQPEKAPATQPQPTEQQKQLMTKIQSAQAEFQKTEVAIRNLEQKTIQKSPDLQKKRDQLKNKIDEKMSSGGYDAKAEAKALQEITLKYKKSGEKPSQEVIADFQKRQIALQQKQQQVMQDKEVQALMKSFNESLLEEAKKLDPNTEALIMRMQKQVEEIQQLRSEFQKTLTK